jgi:AcrR family transcriptional regulator
MNKLPTPHPSTDTREHLLRLAIRLFAERGYNGLTMRDLAEACAVTAPAFYYYFPSKESLYREAVRAAFAVGMQGIDELVQREYDFEGFVYTFTKLLVDAFARSEGFRTLLIRELLNNNAAHLAFIGEEVLGPAMRRIAELAQPLMPAEDARLVGYSVLSLVIGQFTLAPVRGYVSGDRPDELDAGQVVEHVARLLLHGIRRG